MTKASRLAGFNAAFSRLISSTWFLICSLGLLVLHAVWLAITAIYPLPFDEYYHVGIIQIYAEQWSPFIAQQPAEASLYGDITRTPSYLYHWLMSFPYRLIESVIPSLEGKIIALRLINIALMVLAVYLFWRLFVRAGIPKKIANVAVFFFVLTPIVPLLAAHSNYDNLLLVVIAVFFSWCYDLATCKQLSAGKLLVTIALGISATLIKESFLPILLVAGGYTAFCVLKTHGKRFCQEFSSSLKKLSYVKSALLVILLVISFGLVAERYLVNQLVYGNWRARCQDVQTIEVCKDYSPWYRNYNNRQNPPAEPKYGNPVSYSQYWVSRTTRGYYAIFNHTPTEVVSKHEPFGPIALKPLLPIPVSLGIICFVAGVIAIALQFKRLWNNKTYRFFLVISGAYLLILWVFNYTSYLELGTAQAIQARYTLPVMPLLFVTMLQAIAWTVHAWRWRYVVTAIIMAGYLWHGGVIGWLIRADTTWYWQNDRVIELNQEIQSLQKRLKIH